MEKKKKQQDKKKLDFNFYFKIAQLVISLFFVYLIFIGSLIPYSTKILALLVGAFTLIYMIVALVRRKISAFLPTIILVILVYLFF